MIEMKEASYLPNVHLDTISYCNSKCIFCMYHNMQREKKKISWALFKKVVDEIGTWDAETDVMPHHYGEFFLQPKWFTLLRYIGDNAPNAHLAIATNGSRLDNDAIDKLLSIQNLKSITFSVYAYFPATYKKLIGLPIDTLKKLENAIERISQERKDVEIVIGYSPQLLEPHELQLFSEYWSGKKAILLPHIITFNHNIINVTDLSCNKICPNLFEELMVLNNGVVSGCCFDAEGEIFLGNAYDSTLLNIWHGEKIRHFRDLHLQFRRSEISICKSCSRPCDIEYAVYLAILANCTEQIMKKVIK
jgi:sulfatase maturation enzyme AslB (radical SAM superfamily)